MFSDLLLEINLPPPTSLDCSNLLSNWNSLSRMIIRLVFQISIGNVNRVIILYKMKTGFNWLHGRGGKQKIRFR